jgi:hypothetical protein
VVALLRPFVTDEVAFGEGFYRNDGVAVAHFGVEGLMSRVEGMGEIGKG